MLAAGFALVLSGVTFGQASIVGKPVEAGKAVATITTGELTRRGALDKVIFREQKREETESEREFLPLNPNSPKSPTWPVRSNSDSTLQNPLAKVIGTDPIREIGPLFSTGVSFGGPVLGESGAVPPDSTGDVSPSSVIIAANGRIRSYSRTGAVGALNVSDATFFNSVRGTSGMSDPRVVFDRLTQRWFIAEITTSLVSSNNRICLAVSNGEAITASTTWTYFFFTQNVGGGTNGFADYETLGVDANAVYIGINKFNTSLTGFLGCDMFVVRKTSVLGAGPIVVTPFRGISPATGTGVYTPWGATNDDPAATTGLVVGVDNATFGTILARRITTPGGTPALGPLMTITVPATAFPLDAPISTSATTTGSIDGLDDRLFYARIFKNQATGERTLWTAHNIGTDSTGAAGNTRTSSRWYQFNNLFTASNVSLVQSGTVFDSSATPRYYTIPSMAMNGQGHAFIGFTAANTALSPSVGGSYRLVTDALGFTTTPAILATGANYYNAQSTTPNGKRWGDYSVTSVDPRDGMSIWTFQEYCNAANSWQVRALKMLAPAPTASMTATNIAQGATTNITISGTGFFDPDSSYPDHLSINAGTGVTVNSFTWTPTQIVANVTVSAGATLGNRNVVVTNPDGQAVTILNAINVISATKVVSGTVDVDTYNGPLSALVFTAEIRDASTNAVLQTTTINGLGAGGTYSLNTTLAAGNYKLRLKATKRFLGQIQPLALSSTGATGVAFVLTNGDVDGNNAVANPDSKLIRDALGSVLGDENFNEGADLNGDNRVDKNDMEIWRIFVGSVGE